MFTTGTKFSLLLLFTLSLFLASQCYDQNPQIEDTKKQPKQCQRSCSSRYVDVSQNQEKQLCLQHCKDQYGGEGLLNLLGKKKEEEKHEKNPYFFEEQRFESRFRTEEGHFRVLQRFSEKSELLNGIDNYRLAIFESNPGTLFLPHHCDADAIFVVTNGQAIITIVHQKRRESFNLQRGDAIKVTAGAIVYLINHNNNEKLQILKFIHPLNSPGHFEDFFGAGGKSFYGVFSKGYLRASLNVPEDRFERFFEKLEKGIVIKLSQEQIRALTQGQEQGSSSQEQWGEPGSSSQEQEGESSQGQGGESGSSSQEQGGESRGPFNVLQQAPKFANELGQFFEASPDTNEQLRQVGFSVAFLNISKGAMIVPYYNTRSTIVAVVVRGKGEYEMACPHVSKEKKHEKRSDQYEKISARFSEGDVFIIPQGHPISIVASENENLQLVGFGVNARNNHKYFLAGNDNIWNQVPSEIKAIAFESQVREVEEIFGSQPRDYFVPGPTSKQSIQRGEDRGHSMASILEYVGFI